MLRPLYDESDGLDGFVSLEVDPSLADNTSETITAARHLHSLINKPNLYVKIPATPAGVPAIQQLISDGKSVNVTLIFSLERYEEVIEAYLSGLESCEGDLSNISSVASFFISRTDTEVDKRLQAIGSQNALALQEKRPSLKEEQRIKSSKIISADQDGMPSKKEGLGRNGRCGHLHPPKIQNFQTLCM